MLPQFCWCLELIYQSQKQTVFKPFQNFPYLRRQRPELENCKNMDGTVSMLVQIFSDLLRKKRIKAWICSFVSLLQQINWLAFLSIFWGHNLNILKGLCILTNFIFTPQIIVTWRKGRCITIYGKSNLLFENFCNINIWMHRKSMKDCVSIW